MASNVSNLWNIVFKTLVVWNKRRTEEKKNCLILDKIKILCFSFCVSFFFLWDSFLFPFWNTKFFPQRNWNCQCKALDLFSESVYESQIDFYSNNQYFFFQIFPQSRRLFSKLEFQIEIELFLEDFLFNVGPCDQL